MQNRCSTIVLATCDYKLNNQKRIKYLWQISKLELQILSNLSLLPLIQDLDKCRYLRYIKKMNGNHAPHIDSFQNVSCTNPSYWVKPYSH